VIAPDRRPELIGTNLKIVARHLEEGEKPDPNARLECTFNGYVAGGKREVEYLIREFLASSIS